MRTHSRKDRTAQLSYSSGHAVSSRKANQNLADLYEPGIAMMCASVTEAQRNMCTLPKDHIKSVAASQWQEGITSHP